MSKMKKIDIVAIYYNEEADTYELCTGKGELIEEDEKSVIVADQLNEPYLFYEFKKAEGTPRDAKSFIHFSILTEISRLIYEYNYYFIGIISKVAYQSLTSKAEAEE